MAISFGGRGSGGGIELVSRLPAAAAGKVVYVQRPYLGPSAWLDEDFNLTLTPASVVAGGFPALGYSDAGQLVGGNTYIEAGGINPLPPGLQALLIQGNGNAGAGVPGTLFIKLSGELRSKVAGRNLTVSFDGNSYNLHPFVGVSDTWVSVDNSQLVPEADFWAAGTPVTVRVFVTGTEEGFNAGGVARIGQKTKSPYGPYRASDFDLTLSAQSFLPLLTNIGFNSELNRGSLNAPGVGELQTGDGTGRANLIISDADDIALGSPNTIRAVLAGGTVVNLGRDNFDPPGGFEDGYVNFSARGIAAAADFTDGQDYTVRLTTPDQQTGFTPEGIRTIGQGNSPRNVVGGETVEEDFWHVDPETNEWVQGLAPGGGIPGAILPQAGMTDAQKRDEEWRGILVGLAREDAGIDWALQTRAGQEAVQAHTTIASGGTSLRIGLDAGLAGAAGEEGNAWSVDVNPANLSSDPSSARISRTNADNPAVLIIIQQSGRTFAQVAALVNAVAGLTAAVTGPGGTAFPGTIARQSFAGGVNAAELGVDVEEITKTVTLEHLVGHTQAELVAFLNDNQVDADTKLYARLINGSVPGNSPEAAPQSVPFSRIFSKGSLPRPTAAELAALRQEVNAIPSTVRTEVARVLALEAAKTQPDFIGWSDDRVIAAGDLAAAAADTSLIPARAGAGYLWYAVAVARGVPAYETIGGAAQPANAFTAVPNVAYDGANYLILVSAVELSDRLAGRLLTVEIPS